MAEFVVGKFWTGNDVVSVPDVVPEYKMLDMGAEMDAVPAERLETVNVKPSALLYVRPDTEPMEEVTVPNSDEAQATGLPDESWQEMVHVTVFPGRTHGEKKPLVAHATDELVIESAL